MSGNPFAEFLKDEPDASDAKTEETAKPTGYITSAVKDAPSSWGTIERGEWLWAAKCADCDNAYQFRYLAHDGAMVWDSWPGANSRYLCPNCGSTNAPLPPRPAREVLFHWSWFLPYPYERLGYDWRHSEAVKWHDFMGPVKTFRVQR